MAGAVLGLFFRPEQSPPGFGLPLRPLAVGLIHDSRAAVLELALGVSPITSRQ